MTTMKKTRSLLFLYALQWELFEPRDKKALKTRHKSTFSHFIFPRSQNTENYYFFIEFSSSFFFVFAPLKFCQKLANRLLSLLFMKLYFIDFLSSLQPLPSFHTVYFLYHFFFFIFAFKYFLSFTFNEIPDPPGGKTTA